MRQEAKPGWLSQNLFRWERHPADRDGFTLAELLVVVVILVVLAAIAVPVFANQQRKAWDAAARSTVGVLGENLAITSSQFASTTWEGVSGDGTSQVRLVNEVGEFNAYPDGALVFGDYPTREWCVSKLSRTSTWWVLTDKQGASDPYPSSQACTAPSSDPINLDDPGSGGGGGGGGAPVPLDPPVVFAVGGGEQILVQWDEVPGATDYTVTTTPAAPSIPAPVCAASECSTTIPGVDPGVEYTIEVIAIDGNRPGEPSDPGVATATPTVFTPTTVTLATPTPLPFALAVSPDGNTLYAGARTTQNLMLKINPTTGATISSTPITGANIDNSSSSVDARVQSDGNAVWFVTHGGNNVAVAVVNPTNGTVMRNITLAGSNGLSMILPSAVQAPTPPTPGQYWTIGQFSDKIGLAPDNSQFYTGGVTSGRWRSRNATDWSTIVNASPASLSGIGTPNGVLTYGDGTYSYAMYRFGSPSTYRIVRITNATGERVNVADTGVSSTLGGAYTQMQLSHDGDKLYFNLGTKIFVYKFDTGTTTEVWTNPDAQVIKGLALSPCSDKIYTSQSNLPATIYTVTQPTQC